MSHRSRNLLLSLLLATSTIAGCTLIAEVDRSKIPAGDGDGDGEGGDGGTVGDGDGDAVGDGDGDTEGTAGTAGFGGGSN